jgi:hypothetical protein
VGLEPARLVLVIILDHRMSLRTLIYTNFESIPVLSLLLVSKAAGILNSIWSGYGDIKDATAFKHGGEQFRTRFHYA